ncbi:MAG: response regulator transcription factor [Smithella sp.]
MDILVVEDEHSLARVIEVELLLQGMDVKLCYDGKSALHEALGSRFDLIILDWILPDIEGIEICSILRKKGIQTPIIIITARQEVSYEVRGLAEGADDFIVKPFDMEQLIARINAVSRRTVRTKATRDPNDKIVMGSLTIDPAGKAVYSQGKRIHLTKKEFQILMLLLTNRGKVVSKEDIYLSIWGKDIHIEEGAIAVHIKALRDKLKGLKIESVRGFGYMIEDLEN